MNNKNNVAVALLDLTKAFDSIDHSLLLKKLTALGFNQPAIEIISSYLSNRLQRVASNGVFSDWLEVKRGVPQGTILGPLLFSLYVNDMKTNANCEILQYADDTIVMKSAPNVKHATKSVENCISDLISYFEYHSLKLNSDKTEFIVFGKNKGNNKLVVNNIPIEESDTVKYLGVLIDNELKFDKHVKFVLRKMAQGIKSLYVLRNAVPTYLKTIILNAYVLSHIQYPAVLLSTIDQHLVTTLEKQLNWAVKACFNRRKHESSRDLKIKNNILPIKYLLEDRNATYCRLVMNNTKPAFNEKRGVKLATNQFYSQKRTGELIYCAKSSSKILDRSVIKKGIDIHNSMPKSFLSKTEKSAKKHYKNFFFGNF